MSEGEENAMADRVWAQKKAYYETREKRILAEYEALELRQEAVERELESKNRELAAKAMECRSLQQVLEAERKTMHELSTELVGARLAAHCKAPPTVTQRERPATSSPRQQDWRARYLALHKQHQRLLRIFVREFGQS